MFSPSLSLSLSLSLSPLDLDSRLVGKAVLDVVHEVCSEWNSEFPSLMAPKQKIELSLFGIKNNRRKMEDRHALCVDVNSLFSIKVIFFNHTTTRS